MHALIRNRVPRSLAPLKVAVLLAVSTMQSSCTGPRTTLEPRLQLHALAGAKVAVAVQRMPIPYPVPQPPEPHAATETAYSSELWRFRPYSDSTLQGATADRLEQLTRFHITEVFQACILGAASTTDEATPPNTLRFHRPLRKSIVLASFSGPYFEEADYDVHLWREGEHLNCQVRLGLLVGVGAHGRLSRPSQAQIDKYGAVVDAALKVAAWRAVVQFMESQVVPSIPEPFPLGVLEAGPVPFPIEPNIHRLASSGAPLASASDISRRYQALYPQTAASLIFQSPE